MKRTDAHKRAHTAMDDYIRDLAAKMRSGDPTDTESEDLSLLQYAWHAARELVAAKDGNR